MLKKILFLFGVGSLLAIGALMIGCAIKVDSPTTTKNECPPNGSNQVNTTLVKAG